jgi:hypothetical protein
MPWTATGSGETVSASLSPDGGNPYLQLDGNTAWVYTGVSRLAPTGWQTASGSDTAVQLGFATASTTDPTAWSYGETLLTEPNGAAPITIDLSHPVLGIGFQISTLSNPDFIATLIAYSATGQVLGTFVLNTNGTGVGGPCVALKASPTATCSTAAPFIGITQDELGLGAGLIAKVQIFTNAPGFAIGSMDLIETPEPSVMLLAAAGLGLMFWHCRKAGSDTHTLRS